MAASWTAVIVFGPPGTLVSLRQTCNPFGFITWTLSGQILYTELTLKA